MATVHILTQYIWPDAAPTALYAEDVARHLNEHGHDVRLVGGTGDYRALQRDKPAVPVLHLDHYHGRRGSLIQTLIEYASVKRAFKGYIDNVVRSGDIVIVTSAPPNTVALASCIKRRGGRAIYWLHDYYPELFRGIREYPAAMRRTLSRYWDRQLSRWELVVKISANLGGPKHNAIVIRDWPTLKLEKTEPFEPKTALYSGNLGYGHDVDLLVAACAQLREAGYRITIRADGRGVRLLPPWLKAQPLHADPEKLKTDLLRHEVHLIAAHPKITRAIFPSKIWNSIALGRRLICTGFVGAMVEELHAAREARFEQHLDEWVQLIAGLAGVPKAAAVAPIAAPNAEMQLTPASYV